jgi:hypothetical protein
MKTRHASPLIAPVEASSMLRFPPLLACNLLLNQGSFCKDLSLYLTRYCICFTMMNRYMCHLNFLGTHIEASVLFLELGYVKYGGHHIDNDEKKAELYHTGLTIQLQDHLILSQNLSYNDLASVFLDQEGTMRVCDAAE